MAFLDETGLAELWKLIKAEDAKDAKIETGSYIGAGVTSKSLTFNIVPKFLFVCATVNNQATVNRPLIAAYGQDYVGTDYANASSNSATTTMWGWGTKTLSWSGASSLYAQNSGNTEYRYVAIG